MKKITIGILSVLAIFFLTAQSCSDPDCIAKGAIVCVGTEAYECRLGTFGAGTYYKSRVSEYDVSECSAEVEGEEEVDEAVDTTADGVSEESVAEVITTSSDGDFEVSTDTEDVPIVSATESLFVLESFTEEEKIQYQKETEIGLPVIELPTTEKIQYKK